MIEFNCPTCQMHYRVGDELAGKRARCKHCGGEFQVPLPGTSPAVVPSGYPVAAATGQPVTAMQPVAAAVPAPTPRSSEAILGVSNNFAYEITQRPDFSLVTIGLQQGQKIFAEPSAMASMTPTVRMKSGFKGGLGKTIARALGGESLIINTFTAETGPGEVTFAAGQLGDSAYYRLTGNTLYLQRGAFMLHSEGVDLSSKWQGAKGFFSGQGLMLLKASGTGDLFFNSFGAILEVDVTDQYVVDTGYIVAFEDSLQYRVSVLPGLRAGGKIKTFFFGGEGLVCHFSGQGKLWIQTRHVHSFLSWVNPFRPAKKSD